MLHRKLKWNLKEVWLINLILNVYVSVDAYSYENISYKNEMSSYKNEYTYDILSEVEKIMIDTIFQ